VPVDQIPRLVAKELMDNALDQAPDHRTCRIKLIPGENGFTVENGGEGIPGTDEQIAALFSINRPLTSSKMFRKPVRGALGNGLRVVAGVVVAAHGSLRVTTEGRVLELVPQWETGRTIPQFIRKSRRRGCTIEVRFGPELPVESDALDWALDAKRLAAGKSSYRGRSSPHWYDSDSFRELLDAAGDRTARDVIAEMEGCSEPKAGKIAAEFKGRLASDLDRDEADRLLAAARAQARVVKPKAFGRIGQDLLPGAGYHYLADTYRLGSPASAIAAEMPAVIEVWATPQDRCVARLSVNRTPTTGRLTAWKGRSKLGIQGCNMAIYPSIGRQSELMEIWINIDIPYMPITTDGKEPDAGPFGVAIKAAVEKAVRIARRRSTADPESGRITQKDFYYKAIPGAAKRAGGGFRFGQRQLFYTIRPDFIKVFGKEPDWNYFTQVVTDYENEYGDIPGMYRDPRGIIYHPHLGEEIPLGTIYVENYRRPAWLFNKVLYCEKEGFFATLRGVGWPERNDCALMTSKGFSSRAARDLIDMLAETDEECEFFCIHDADAAGTMIYQTLVEATKARGARKVHIHNLGLDPAEARDMGLQVEEFPEKPNRLRVADYIDDDEEWLQRNRIELNAMTTPQFLEWLDDKFRPYRGKLIPPDEALQERLDRELRAYVEGRITRAVLRRHDIDGAVERAMGRRAEAIAEASGDLAGMIRGKFRKDARSPWTRPIDRLARKLSRRPGREDTP
jgi:hypothetical protein